MNTYQVQVRFFFIQSDLDESQKDSEKFEMKADSIEECHKKSFDKVINNWDAGAIGIYEINIA